MQPYQATYTTQLDRTVRFLTRLVAVALLLATIETVAAQPSSSNSGIITDQVIFKDGTTRSGLITLQNAYEIELMEIERPPGRPSYAVVRVYSQQNISKIIQVDESEKSRLTQIAEKMRNRVQIESKQLNAVSLYQVELNEQTYHHFVGEGFVLLSQLDEGITKKIAIRADQVFRAFRHVIPTQTQPDSVLRIIVLGSDEAYRDYQQRLGFSVQNPAIYLPSQNLILISSNLEEFNNRLKISLKQHHRQRKEWEQREASLPAQLLALSEQLKRDGLNRAAIETELNLRKTAFHRERENRLKEIQAADRKNQNQLEGLIDETLEKLYHESFHAYLENFVFPSKHYDVPIWLNEGLAQIFEHGQLENEAFRIDQPPKEMFGRIAKQADLKLSQLLNDKARSFLPTEALHNQAMQYDAAWAFTWYLISHHQLLEQGKLELLISDANTPRKPETSIQQLTGSTIPKLEADWQNYLKGQAE